VIDLETTRRSSSGNARVRNAFALICADSRMPMRAGAAVDEIESCASERSRARRRRRPLGSSELRNRSVAEMCRGSELHSQASAICGSSSEPSGSRAAARRSMRKFRARRMRRLLRIEGVASLAVSVEVGRLAPAALE
jgi:hypothetical protein